MRLHVVSIGRAGVKLAALMSLSHERDSRSEKPFVDGEEAPPPERSLSLLHLWLSNDWPLQ